MQDWLNRASEAFERERLYLVRLTSAVGPLPSTPGAAETEASLVAARHALETLAMSERDGCALGAATALVGDWWPVRRLLDRAATRAGTEAPAPSLPDESLGRLDRRHCDRDSRKRTSTGLRWRAAAAPAPRALRPARSARRSPRRILSGARPLRRARSARWRRPAIGCDSATSVTFALREDQPRSEHDQPEREIGADRNRRVPQDDRRERHAQEHGVEPEILANRFADAKDRVRPQRKGDLVVLRVPSFTPSAKFQCPLLSKSRANSRKSKPSNGLAVLQARRGGNFPPSLRPISWEFAPYAASAMLHRST